MTSHSSSCEAKTWTLEYLDPWKIEWDFTNGPLSKGRHESRERTWISFPKLPSRGFLSIDGAGFLPFDQAFVDLKNPPNHCSFSRKKWWNMSIFFQKPQENYNSQQKTCITCPNLWRCILLTVLSTFQVGYLRYKKISAVENSIASMTSEALLAELRKNDQPRKGKKARPETGPILKPSSRSF